MIDSLDKKIIRRLQEDISVIATPYKEIADELNMNEDELIQKSKLIMKLEY